MHDVCWSFVWKSDVSLNRLLCAKIEQRVTDKELLPAKKLPPTGNSFYLHILWCVYHLMIWRNANIAAHDLPDATEFGYEMDSETHSLHPLLVSNLVYDCDPTFLLGFNVTLLPVFSACRCSPGHAIPSFFLCGCSSWCQHPHLGSFHLATVPHTTLSLLWPPLLLSPDDRDHP